jgi:hypothetical protein
MRSLDATGFPALTLVSAVVANTPHASMVLQSACIPAPPLESLPAMVSATGGETGDGACRSLMSCLLVGCLVHVSLTEEF